MSADDDLWHVQMGGDAVRTLTLAQLDDAFQNGQIDERALVRAEGDPEWKTLKQLLGDEPEAAEPPSGAPSGPAVPLFATKVQTSPVGVIQSKPDPPAPHIHNMAAPPEVDSLRTVPSFTPGAKGPAPVRPAAPGRRLKLGTSEPNLSSDDRAPAGADTGTLDINTEGLEFDFSNRRRGRARIYVAAGLAVLAAAAVTLSRPSIRARLWGGQSAPPAVPATTAAPSPASAAPVAPAPTASSAPRAAPPQEVAPSTSASASASATLPDASSATARPSKTPPATHRGPAPKKTKMPAAHTRSSK